MTWRNLPDVTTSGIFIDGDIAANVLANGDAQLDEEIDEDMEIDCLSLSEFQLP